MKSFIILLKTSNSWNFALILWDPQIGSDLNAQGRLRPAEREGDPKPGGRGHEDRRQSQSDELRHRWSQKQTSDRSQQRAGGVIEKTVDTNLRGRQPRGREPAWGHAARLSLSISQTSILTEDVGQTKVSIGGTNHTVSSLEVGEHSELRKWPIKAAREERLWKSWSDYLFRETSQLPKHFGHLESKILQCIIINH